MKLIIDTDMVENIPKKIFDFNSYEDFDVDDVGALCAAHGLVQLGEAEILTVGK